MKFESNTELNNLANELRQTLLNENCQTDDFKVLIEALVHAQNDVRIQIHPRDHNPPHCHVDAGGRNASVDIRTGEVLQGGLGHAANRIIQQFWQQNQSKLMDIWNKTRPGIISEGVSHFFNYE